MVKRLANINDETFKPVRLTRYQLFQIHLLSIHRTVNFEISFQSNARSISQFELITTRVLLLNQNIDINQVEKNLRDQNCSDWEIFRNENDLFFQYSQHFIYSSVKLTHTSCLVPRPWQQRYGCWRSDLAHRQITPIKLVSISRAIIWMFLCCLVWSTANA